MHRLLRWLILPLLALPLSAEIPRFRAHTIATDLASGYQVVPHDVNHDGRPDLIALASRMKELVWFENPDWRRHVLAEGMERMINLAACPGLDAILVAYHFANNPADSIGAVDVLRPNQDPSRPWNRTTIDRLATSHRLRCAVLERDGKPVVVNAPLAGAEASPPEYRAKIPLVLYRPGVWRRELIGDQLQGVLHGILIDDWDGDGRDDILTASFEGIHVYSYGRTGRWSLQRIAAGNPQPWPKSGSSDVAIGRLGRRRFLAAIEPWHGNQVAVYVSRGGQWRRTIIDDSLTDGHTILTADLDGDGHDEVVTGHRGGVGGVHIYMAADPNGLTWRREILEQGIRAAACAAVDLNGDGRPDLACIGQASANLKWYENLGTK